MKTLHQYIEESLLRGMEDTLDRGEDDIKKILVEDFINDIYVCESGKSQIPMTISDKLNSKGLFEVVIHDSISLKDCWSTKDKQNVKSLTNGHFVIKKVKGDYSILHCELDSLEGCPEEITGNCYIGSVSYRGHVTTLKGGPKKIGNTFKFTLLHLESLDYLPEIGGSLLCCGCSIKSLKGCPKHVKGNFKIVGDRIENLEFGPEKVDGYYECCSCPKLTSLKGCPKQIKGYFKCSWNMNLTSLEGCPEIVEGDFIKNDCGKRFTKKSVEKYCKVMGFIM